MTDSQKTLDGLVEYYAQRTVFERGDAPSREQLVQAIGECQTMVGSLIRLVREMRGER